MPGDPGVLWRTTSVVGMLLLVVAYLLNQRRVWAPTSTAYLVANALGSAMLAAYSWRIDEFVFVGLEGFWFAATVLALGRARRDARQGGLA